MFVSLSSLAFWPEAVLLLLKIMLTPLIINIKINYVNNFLRIIIAIYDRNKYRIK